MATGTAMAFRHTIGEVVISVDWPSSEDKPTYTAYRDPGAPAYINDHNRAGERHFEIDWPITEGEPTIEFYSDSTASPAPTTDK